MNIPCLRPSFFWFTSLQIRADPSNHWILRSGTCPVCRQILADDEEEEGEEVGGEEGEEEEAEGEDVGDAAGGEGEEEEAEW